MNSSETLTPVTNYAPRKHGLKWVCYGTAAFVAAILINNWLLPKLGFQLGLGSVVAFAACGAYVLMGLLEVITNKPFLYWAQKWNELKGWQRGVLGTLIAIIALFLSAFAIVWYVG